VINLPNERSVAFHESMGFSYFATFEKVGYKLGKWKDVGWWRLQLNDYLQEPAAPLKLSEMSHDVLKELLNST
jgi:phosphinothricin acetyltransferase